MQCNQSPTKLHHDICTLVLHALINEGKQSIRLLYQFLYFVSLSESCGPGSLDPSAINAGQGLIINCTLSLYTHLLKVQQSHLLRLKFQLQVFMTL